MALSPADILGTIRSELLKGAMPWTANTATSTQLLQKHFFGSTNQLSHSGKHLAFRYLLVHFSSRCLVYQQ